MAIKINNDATIQIATGRSRTTKVWKNKKMLWSALLAQLQEPTRTRETVAEYRKLPKAEQDAIKDVGGYVAAYLKEGRRKSGFISNRSVITLDADFAATDFLLALDLRCGDIAFAYYTTHKHVPEAPRYRLLVPLSRPVTGEEYQALARAVAADIGIDYFDDTTYEPERLMYWPSVSADGEYKFDYSDMPFLNVDEWLSTKYEDWKDSTAWPESSRAAGIRKTAAIKQGDPLEKPGLIGAFCKAYSIEEAIAKFLPEAYTKCDAPGRYTYAKGSTAAGLVIYDDVFAYSHHGTDPVSGLLVNAFDLVRIHKYGDQDDGNPDTPINKRKSFELMSEFAAKDAQVQKQLDEDRKRTVEEDFSEAPADDAWKSGLARNKKGSIESDPINVKLILMNDPLLKDKAGINDFNYYTEVMGDLPWRKAERGKLWTDRDDAGLRNYLFAAYGIRGKDMIQDACSDVFEQRHFHPVREYILSKPWDGVKRAEALWIDYLGAADTPYTRMVTRTHLTAAVARIFVPGIKFDNILVLAGPQGIGKSTMLNKLGGEWFNDTFSTVVGKEAFEQLQGSWIIEVSELYAARKAENEAVKQFLSKRDDVYREAYGRRVRSHPRQCVFYGTTNDSEFLRDRTGNRRFWPVDVTEHGRKDFKSFSEEEVQQVWAEAYNWFKSGQKLYLDKEMEKKAMEMQEWHSEVSPDYGRILEFLEMKIPEEDTWNHMDLRERRTFLLNEDGTMPEGTRTRSKITALEFLCEYNGLEPGKVKSLDVRNFNSLMRNVPEWELHKNPLNFGTLYGRQRGYVKAKKIPPKKVKKEPEKVSILD